MGRVKIFHTSPREIATRRKLLGILAPKIKVTRLIPVHEAVVVLTATDLDADAIFQDGMLRRLEVEGFKPLLPQELRSQRSVICTRLDDLVYDNTAEDMGL